MGASVPLPSPVALRPQEPCPTKPHGRGITSPELTLYIGATVDSVAPLILQGITIAVRQRDRAALAVGWPKLPGAEIANLTLVLIFVPAARRACVWVSDRLELLVREGIDRRVSGGIVVGIDTLVQRLFDA